MGEAEGGRKKKQQRSPHSLYFRKERKEIDEEEEELLLRSQLFTRLLAVHIIGQKEDRMTLQLACSRIDISVFTYLIVYSSV